MTQPSDTPQTQQPIWRNKKWVILGSLLIVIVAIVVGVLLANHEPKKVSDQPVSAPAITRISITKDGFRPATAAIKTGSIVEWSSKDDTKSHVIAANPLKTHTELPSLVSDQLGIGKTYRFKFDKAGTYHYHDELNPTLNGTITVE